MKQRNHILCRKQPLGTHIDPVEPLSVDILELPDLRTLWEQQLILSPSSRVPSPLSHSSYS